MEGIMRKLTVYQWNFLWTRGNGGCTYQGTDEADVLAQAVWPREAVRITSDDHPDMFGVVLSSRVDDLLEGRI